MSQSVFFGVYSVLPALSTLNQMAVILVLTVGTLVVLSTFNLQFGLPPMLPPATQAFHFGDINFIYDFPFVH